MTAEIDGDRPQDVGRRHRRRGSQSPETVALLARGQAAMRAEIIALLGELEAVAEPGLLKDAPPVPRIPLDDPKRDRLWDRAVKLMRELGSAIDADPVPVTPAAGSATRLRRRRVEFA